MQKGLSVLLLAGSALLAQSNDPAPALKGYDPVAYFTRNQAVMGKADLTAAHNGRTYRFSTPEHKKAFEAEPAKFLPQFEEQCAWAVSQNYAYPADPTAFTVYQGKLYLNANAEVSKKFNADLPGLTAKAEKNWPSVKGKMKTMRR